MFPASHCVYSKPAKRPDEVQEYKKYNMQSAVYTTIFTMLCVLLIVTVNIYSTDKDNPGNYKMQLLNDDFIY